MFYFSIFCIKIMNVEVLIFFFNDFGIIIKIEVDVWGYNG